MKQLLPALMAVCGGCAVPSEPALTADLTARQTLQEHAARLDSLQADVDSLRSSQARQAPESVKASSAWVLWERSHVVAKPGAVLARPLPAKAIDALENRTACLSAARALVASGGGHSASLTVYRASHDGAVRRYSYACLPEGTNG